MWQCSTAEQHAAILGHGIDEEEEEEEDEEEEEEGVVVFLTGATNSNPSKMLCLSN